MSEKPVVFIFRNTLMIRDGGSMRAPPVPGNLTDGKDFLSRTNIVLVEYVFEPGTTKEKGFPFQLNFTAYGKIYSNG